MFSRSIGLGYEPILRNEEVMKLYQTERPVFGKSLDEFFPSPAYFRHWCSCCCGRTKVKASGNRLREPHDMLHRYTYTVKQTCVLPLISAVTIHRYQFSVRHKIKNFDPRKNWSVVAGIQYHSRAIRPSFLLPRFSVSYASKPLAASPPSLNSPPTCRPRSHSRPRPHAPLDTSNRHHQQELRKSRESSEAAINILGPVLKGARSQLGLGGAATGGYDFRPPPVPPPRPVQTNSVPAATHHQKQQQQHLWESENDQKRAQDDGVEGRRNGVGLLQRSELDQDQQQQQQQQYRDDEKEVRGFRHRTDHVHVPPGWGSGVGGGGGVVAFFLFLAFWSLSSTWLFEKREQSRIYP